jgi:hypothetical protein
MLWQIGAIPSFPRFYRFILVLMLCVPRGEVFLIFSSISPGAFRILMTFLFFAVKCMALFGVHRNNGICTHTALTLASALVLYTPCFHTLISKTSKLSQVCLNLCLLQSTLQVSAPHESIAVCSHVVPADQRAF